MIEVRNLTKRFGETVAVDDLSFSVRPGAGTGFLGPNGAGKSTTMRMMLGLDRPTSGVALIRGRAYVEAPVPLNEVGALLDARDVHGGRRGRSHLRALARSNGLPPRRLGRPGRLALGAAQRGSRCSTVASPPSNAVSRAIPSAGARRPWPA